jgi:ligand-binding sensor domain-containing protein
MRGRRALTLTLVLTVMLSAQTQFASALDSSLDVNQYAHTAWKIRKGFAKGEIFSIAQTPDGHLWLGSEFGLLRFDGVRAVPWQPPADQHLPSNYIFSLLVARDGTFWIGTWNGLASWRDGRLMQYPDLTGLIFLHSLRAMTEPLGQRIIICAWEALCHSQWQCSVLRR